MITYLLSNVEQGHALLFNLFVLFFRVLQYALKVVNHYHLQRSANPDVVQKWKQLESSLSSFRKR